MGRALTARLGRFFRDVAFVGAMALAVALGAVAPSLAAPFAAYVMDARTGETLYAKNADTPLHPASLTKMMTLYITFEEIERGNLSLDTMVTVSKNAAAQPPSRLGLKAGQKIALRYLIRAAAVKSANDAAAAIGDFIGGSPAKFGERMTRTARALGMNNTTFKNANGLTAKGHLSTAHDMSILGRRLFYDFPQYYNIFSRRTTDAGIAEVNSTNRRFLDSYSGADGIKTGYTDAAGFNLTASAERNGVRIIATVFGGTSTANRNAKVAELLDLGFKKAPRNAQTVRPPAPDYQGNDMIASVDDELPEVADGAGKTVRVMMAVNSSPRPMPRPGEVEMDETVVAAMQEGIMGALAEATAPEQGAEVANADPEVEAPAKDPLMQLVSMALGGFGSHGAVPEEGTIVALSAHTPSPEEPAPQALSVAASTTNRAVVLVASPRPAKRNAPIFDAVARKDLPVQPETEVVTTVSTSGGADWGVVVGDFPSNYEAERNLLKIQLAESATLGTALRKIIRSDNGAYAANFLGLSQQQADLACRRLAARSISCFTVGP